MMLNFTPAELEQVESASDSSSKWFSGLLKTSPPANKGRVGALQAEGQTGGLNRSFTELLIQYVDRESKPMPNLAFDINNTTAMAKKTDAASSSPGISPAAGTSNSSASASALKFFNNNLSQNREAGVSGDQNLVNRSQSSSTVNQQSQQPPTTATSASASAISNLSSPAVANSFLEQILK